MQEPVSIVVGSSTVRWRPRAAHGYVPVLACLGVGAGGAVFNINADTVANRVAIELSASGLFLISDEVYRRMWEDHRCATKTRTEAAA